VLAELLFLGTARTIRRSAIRNFPVPTGGRPGNAGHLIG
jgi:hypothetical protein